MSARQQRRQRGIVLVVVLWGVVLLALAAFALATAMRAGVEGLASQKEQLQARYDARGAIYETLGMLLAPPPMPAGGEAGAYTGPPLHADWNGEGWKASVQIEDEAGKLDLNHAPEEVLVGLFRTLGLSEEAAQSLGDAVEAWRNPDISGGMNGGEDAFYSSLQAPYRPAHADFQSVAELLEVRGVTMDLYYGRYVTRADGRVERRPGLVDCLTVKSSGGAININSAPYPVLLAIPGMDAQTANYIVQERQQQPFASLNKLNEDAPEPLAVKTLSYLATQASGRFSLLATATRQSGVKARVLVVAQMEPGKDPPFEIRKWDENYVR